MNAAYDSGEAVPLAQSVSWLVRYRRAWWVVYERGWLCITDDITVADLDQAAARLAQAEAATARDTDLRSILAPPVLGPARLRRAGPFHVAHTPTGNDAATLVLNDGQHT